MSGETDAEQRREQREAQYVAARLKELFERPITGAFDIQHLKAIHAYLFQDFPDHKPGIIRERTEEAWIKHRALEGQSDIYLVYYANNDIENRITRALQRFGGPAAIKGQSPDSVAAHMAKLYADLDHAHGFYEGNSRTLREFMRALALEAGYILDWVRHGVTASERNQLYIARDLAVLERAFPHLTEQTAMQTTDRAEYEAWVTRERLRHIAGATSLETIIRAGLTPKPTTAHDRT